MRSLRLRRISHVLSSSTLFPSASAFSLLPTVSSGANNAGRQERGSAALFSIASFALALEFGQFWRQANC